VTDLDELRRIAYGRTTSPADEEAAVTARVALADHAAEQQRVAARRAAEQRAELQRAEHLRDAELRAAELRDGRDPAQNETPADEPGRLRRLVSAWRVWAVPAFAAFVVGIALTGASVYLVSTTAPDGANPSNEPDFPLVDPIAEGTLAIPSGPMIVGDLAAAELALARPQSQGDALEVVDSFIDASSVRLIDSSGFVTLYAARSVDAQLCLVAVDKSRQLFDEASKSTATIVTCVAPDVFAAQGLAVEVSDPARGRITMNWNGSEVSTTTIG